MVKHHVSNSVFNFTWEQVTRAFWNRYPNPYSNHVLSEDVVSREVVGGKLFTKKLITKTNKIPKWGERFIVGSKAKGVYLIEESIVDPDAKMFVTYTRNIGMKSILVVGEKTVYSPNPSDLATTISMRIGWFQSMLPIYGISRPVEAFATERFKKNIKSTVKGLEYVLEKTFLPNTIENTSALTTGQLKEKAKKAKDIAKRAGQNVVTTYAGKTAA